MTTSSHERHRQIEALIQRLTETDQALQAFGQGELDAVVDPASAGPILLSHAQKALAESEARYRDLVTRSSVRSRRMAGRPSPTTRSAQCSATSRTI